MATQVLAPLSLSNLKCAALNGHSKSISGPLTVTLRVISATLIPKKQVYEMEIGTASIISTNSASKSITIHVAASKVNQVHKDIADDDIDELLDEIDSQGNVVKSGSSTSTNGAELDPIPDDVHSLRMLPHHPPILDPDLSREAQYGSSSARTQSMSTSIRDNRPLSIAMDPILPDQPCVFSTDQCFHIQRTVFVLKYYGLWRHRKMRGMNCKQNPKHIHSVQSSSVQFSCFMCYPLKFPMRFYGALIPYP